MEGAPSGGNANSHVFNSDEVERERNPSICLFDPVFGALSFEKWVLCVELGVLECVEFGALLVGFAYGALRSIR